MIELLNRMKDMDRWMIYGWWTDGQMGGWLDGCKRHNSVDITTITSQNIYYLSENDLLRVSKDHLKHSSEHMVSFAWGLTSSLTACSLWHQHVVLNQCIPLSLCAYNNHTKANAGHQKNHYKDTWPWTLKESPTETTLQYDI